MFNKSLENYCICSYGLCIEKEDKYILIILPDTDFTR